MPPQSAAEYPDTQSFLRNGSDPAVGDAGSGEPGRKAAESGQPGPLFPPPPLVPEHLRPLAEWDTFIVLAVRIDRSHSAEGNKALQDDLGQCIQAVAEAHQGTWFQWRHDLFACVLPGGPTDATANLAGRLQGELGKRRVETISVGVTHFPLLGFSREETLVNACKALDHAAFFGPGSIVPFDAVSLNISGDSFYQAGLIDEAIAEYRTALAMDANDVNVRNSLGVCLAEQGKSEEAMEMFRSVSRIDPEEAMAAYNLGALHLIANDTDQALALFRKAYALEDRTFEIPFQIGKVLADQKEYEEARTHLEAAIALRGDYSPAHSLLGRCLACLGQSRDAIAAYKKAVKINPNDAPALSALGALYDTRGENPDICIAFCEQSVALAPDNGLFRLRLARLFHKHKQLDRALEEYERATELGCDAGRQIAKIAETIASSDEDRQCCAG